MAVTNKNKVKETDETGERTLNHMDASDDANDDTGDNNDEIEDSQQAIDQEEGKSPSDKRVIRNNMNILSQMNMSQLAIEEEEQNQHPTHYYNLRERHIKQKQQVSLVVTRGGDIT